MLPLVAVSIAGCMFGCERSGSEPPRATANQSLDSPKSSAAGAPAKAGDYLISPSGMAGIELGMTLDEARRTVPSAKFERTSDGEGVALVEVTVAPGTSMVLWAGEDDPDARIDWTKKIRMIESFNPNFGTAEGVRPGSLVVDVEKLYGRTKQIQKSEIESREYITFERQPSGFTFRLDYTGVFPDDSSTTREFAAGARIHSIAISS